jgi:hypothetical protein
MNAQPAAQTTARTFPRKARNWTTLNTNKSNWTGGSITVDVSPDGMAFEMYGYSFVIEQTYEDEFCTMWNVYGDGWSGRLAFVTKEKARPGWRDDNAYAFADGMAEEMHREAPSVIEAVVKLLCNII